MIAHVGRRQVASLFVLGLLGLAGLGEYLRPAEAAIAGAERPGVAQLRP